MKRTVFVTGAAGFVGANIIHRLLKERNDIHIAVRPGGSLWRLEDAIGRITVHEGILTDPERLQKTLIKIRPDGIFHLAAYGSYPNQKDDRLMIATNITGLMNLLEASRDIPYRRFVVSGSSSEYGRKDKPMREDDVLEPNNMYAITKAAATHLAVYFGKTFHKPVTVFRYFSIYGPWEEEGRLVRTVIENALKGESVKLATGTEVRDFVYAGDVADAYIRIMESQKQTEGEILNLGTGRETATAQLAEMVIKLTGSRSRIIRNVYSGRPWDAHHWRAYTGKTARMLGWRAETPLKKGLKQTILWYKDRIDTDKR